MVMLKIQVPHLRETDREEGRWGRKEGRKDLSFSSGSDD
jgi:hypothetical protein